MNSICDIAHMTCASLSSTSKKSTSIWRLPCIVTKRTYLFRTAHREVSNFMPSTRCFLSLAGFRWFLTRVSKVQKHGDVCKLFHVINWWQLERQGFQDKPRSSELCLAQKLWFRKESTWKKLQLTRETFEEQKCCYKVICDWHDEGYFKWMMYQTNRKCP